MTSKKDRKNKKRRQPNRESMILFAFTPAAEWWRTLSANKKRQLASQEYGCLPGKLSEEDIRSLYGKYGITY